MVLWRIQQSAIQRRENLIDKWLYALRRPIGSPYSTESFLQTSLRLIVPSGLHNVVAVSERTSSCPCGRCTLFALSWLCLSVLDGFLRACYVLGRPQAKQSPADVLYFRRWNLFRGNPSLQSHPMDP